MFKKVFLVTALLASFSAYSANNRNVLIQNQQDLDEEISYLFKNFDADRPDTLIRLFDYVNRHSEDKGYIINKFSLNMSKNEKKSKNIKFIVDYISEHIVDLDTKNIPKNGEWSGQSGHSNFFVTGHTRMFTKSEIMADAPNGIPFDYGYPDFSSFRIGELIPIKDPMASYPHDYERVVQSLIYNKTPFNGIIFNSKEEFNEYIQSKYADLHYSLRDNAFELIPNTVASVIDYELPHVSKRKPH